MKNDISLFGLRKEVKICLTKLRQKRKHDTQNQTIIIDLHMWYYENDTI